MVTLMCGVAVYRANSAANLMQKIEHRTDPVTAEKNDLIESPSVSAV